MCQTLTSQRFILQIPLHGIHLGHAVGDRRSRGKYYAAPARKFIEIAALHKEVGRFLCLGLRQSRYVSHFCVEEQVFEAVRLVYIEPVYAELLEGHNIVLAALVVQLFELQLDLLLCLFKLLDRETLRVGALGVGYAVHDLVKLLLQHLPLAFYAHWYLLELRMPDNDGIVISRGDTRAKLLAVSGFKVLFRCHKDVRGRVKLQKLRRPLLGKVVRHNEQALLTQPQPLAFHGCGDHFKGLTSTHNVRQQRVAAVQDAGDSVHLVRAKRYLGIHARKADMASIVLAGAYAVELGIVERGQSVAAVRVFPYPVAESVLDRLLLLLREYGVLLVQHPCFITALVNDGIEYAHVL